MPCNVESASLEPKTGSRFIAGGEDMWVHLFDFFTGEEIGMYIILILDIHCIIDWEIPY
jgi:serine-threonine kinase receptor-associated protein